MLFIVYQKHCAKHKNFKLKMKNRQTNEIQLYTDLNCFRIQPGKTVGST